MSQHLLDCTVLCAVLLPGAEGPVAARIIRELASSGIKVVAGRCYSCDSSSMGVDPV